MCELLVGLPAVTVLGIDDEPGEPLAVHVETKSPKTERPGCRTCASFAIVKDRPLVPHACHTERHEGRIEGQW
jgi:hypothetical protein